MRGFAPAVLGTETIRQVVAPWAAGKPEIRAVALIGSRAGSRFRGRGPLPESDIDLAAVLGAGLDGFEEEAQDYVARVWAAELQQHFSAPVHLLHCRRDVPTVWHAAKDTRIWLYYRCPCLLGRSLIAGKPGQI